MMKVKVLGGGCSKCAELYENANSALNDLGVEFEIEKVEDMGEIMSHGVMSTPALVVDEKVLFSGQVLNSEKIKDMLK